MIILEGMLFADESSSMPKRPSEVAAGLSLLCVVLEKKRPERFEHFSSGGGLTRDSWPESEPVGVAPKLATERLLRILEGKK